ncbi:alpha/beta hydrolase [Oryzihumus sp.]
MPVLPGAEPFSADAGDIGVVVLHGFTGCPQSMRPWAQAFADAGYSVRLPLLPGHGTRWQDLNETTWPQWYRAAADAFGDLRSRCRAVFAVGLSMGGCLALRLAEERGDEVSGLVIVNPYIDSAGQSRLLPALRVIRLVVPSFPGVISDIKKPGQVELGYDRVPLHAFASLQTFHKLVRADLAKVTQPLLLMYSAVDHTVPTATNAATIHGRVSSADYKEIVLEDSYHVATLDNDAERIEKESVAFVARLSGRPDSPASGADKATP